MLKTRIITATVLALFVGNMLFFAAPVWWQLLLAVVVFGMGYEWSGFVKEDRLMAKIAWGGAVMIAVVSLAFSGWFESLFLFWTLLSTLAMISLVLLYQKNEGGLLVTHKLVLFALAVLVLTAFFYSMMTVQLNFTPQIILLCLFVVWAVDTGAYFSGKKFGKRKLAYFVSPGKTWEGVYGGAILSYVVALIGLLWVAPDISISIYALAALLSLVGVLSVFGDLFESLLKRQVAMKDSSQILPGHGGLLDRMDSLLLAMPLFALILKAVSV